MGSRLINARAETLAQKPSFRHAFKRRRCLILADGFYEWKRVENRKQPYYFQLKNGQPFALAGLWEIWQPREGEAIASCTIITTKANTLMQPIHDRMPAILEPDSYHQWLDSRLTDTDALKPLLKPYESQLMSAVAVSFLVNNPANDIPECLTLIALEP
jgi:putative SOS response-associated peptidase YedK